MKLTKLDDYQKAWMNSDPQRVADFITEAFADDDPATALMALKSVALNYEGGVQGLSRNVGISRQAINAALSEQGNPTISNFLVMLHELGFDIHFTHKASG
jgi:probable addiction module antidote protein